VPARHRIELLPDFERFPEGELGVVVYALLAELAQSCPDRGDFGQLVQGVEAITRSAAKVGASCGPRVIRTCRPRRSWAARARTCSCASSRTTVRFTGRGKDLELVCAACVATPGSRHRRGSIVVDDDDPRARPARGF
jgi:hypothetical protein